MATVAASCRSGGGPGHVLITSRNPHWSGVVGRAQVLAVEQAAAYMETRDCGAADYMRLFRRQRQALPARAKPPDAYHATITTWELAFAHAWQTEGTAALLNLCCCLAPDDIPLTLLARLAANLAAEPLLAAGGRRWPT